jgi:hypothetical protein
MSAAKTALYKILVFGDKNWCPGVSSDENYDYCIHFFIQYFYDTMLAAWQQPNAA